MIGVIRVFVNSSSSQWCDVSWRMFACLTPLPQTILQSLASHWWGFHQPVCGSAIQTTQKSRESQEFFLVFQVVFPCHPHPLKHLFKIYFHFSEWSTMILEISAKKKSILFEVTVFSSLCLCALECWLKSKPRLWLKQCLRKLSLWIWTRLCDLRSSCNSLSSLWALLVFFFNEMFWVKIYSFLNRMPVRNSPTPPAWVTSHPVLRLVLNRRKWRFLIRLLRLSLAHTTLCLTQYWTGRGGIMGTISRYQQQSMLCLSWSSQLYLL